MTERDESRRQFLKETATVLTTAVAAETASAAPQAEPAKPLDVVAALGDVIIPTDGPSYPGYRRLEEHGISARVLDQLRHLDRVTPADLTLFNESARNFTGKNFLESDASGRGSYLEVLFAGTDGPKTRLDAATMKSLQRTLKLSRDRILTVFYRNFPYDTVDRDENGFPIPNRPHEIFDLKKTNLVTGWDVAGHRGPLSWVEEEDRRNRFKKILWSEENTVK
jgi:hypothetical protein